MKVYRPIKSNHLNQSFGADLACAKKGVRPFKVITRTALTCPQGYESLYKMLGMKGHNGEDWAAWRGEAIYFPVEAETKWYAKTESDKDGGLGVDVISQEPILNGKRIKFRFWHIMVPSVYDGQEIKMGDIIALADSTGASSGDHLHWSMKVVDANGNTEDIYNGYYGAVNFRPYFENVFILDVLKVEKQALNAIDLARKVILEVKQYFLSLKKK